MLAPSWPDRTTANLEYPLCRDARHEAAVRAALRRTLDLLLARLPAGQLVALVLTGSFARGEGSVMDTAGRPRVLGDIECLVVLPSEVEFHRFRTRMPEWSREASRAVAHDIDVDIELGPVEIGYLRRRARPSIFVYDLIRHGKVVWGPPDILDEVPRFGTGDIPRDDALHLLCNRTIEQLEAYDRTAVLDGDRLWDVAYQRLKLTLDVAGSALAFAGRHEPSYEARPAAFAGLLAETPGLRAALPSGFSAELARAARLKLAPGDGDAVMPRALHLDAQRAWIRRQIVDAVPAVTGLLRWQLAQRLDARGALPELLTRWAHTPTLGRRIWDWAKVVLHPLPPPLRISRARSARLFLHSTPRALLYAAGVLAYLDLAQPTTSPARIARLLPVARAAVRRDPQSARHAITSLWRWCVRNT